MKRSIFFIAALAASALTGAASAYFVNNHQSDVVVAPHATTEFASESVGSHFTAYDSQNYPDLTYAAENAVKAGFARIRPLRYSPRLAA